MGYARYIGRVGALAVALGIGVALANGPATAWADGADGSPSGPASASDSSAGADSKSDTSGAAGAKDVSSDGPAGNATPGAGGGNGDAASDDADDDQSTDSAKENDESGADDAAARDGSTSDSGQPVAVRKGSRVSQRESLKPRKSEVKVRSEAASSAKRSPAATAVSITPSTGAVGTAPQAVSVSEKRRSVKISAPVRPADVVEVTAVSTAVPAPTKTVTTALLSALGLSPLATGGPTDVPEAPVAWAIFAALRRQSDEDAGTEQKLVSVADPAARTMSVEDAAEPMVAMAAAVNGAPSASPTIGLPETVNGVVTGKLNAVDPESNPLTYAVQSKSAGATVTVDGAGNFTYAPSQAARLQAATTTGLVVDTDTFTVRVSDGQTFTDVPVTVVVRPGQLATGAPVDVGRDPSGVAFNADGTRAYVTNQWDKTVSVVNTSSGAVLATITVPYAPNAIVVSPVAGQNRAYVATSTGVAVINTTTNKVVDVKPSTSTVDVIAVGTSPSALAINSTGTRLYVSNLGSTTVSVVNTGTNLEITKVTVGSQPSGLVVSADGSRLYALSRANGTVTAIDTATNQVLGSAVRVGVSPRSVVISPSGQLYVTNYTSGTVTVLNTTAAAPVLVKTLTVGTQPDGIAVSKDGSLVYVANGKDTVSVINTATNTVTGTVPIGGTGASGAHAIAVSGNTMYVTDHVEDWVRVINVTRVQTAPQANGAPTVGTPDATTGTVTGALNVIDTDGDALSYSVTTAPAKGTLTINPNGTYTYKPTDAARQQAAHTGGSTTDNFTVRVTDPSGSFRNVSVTAPIKPASAVPGIAVTVTAIPVNTYPTAVAFSGNNAFVYGGDVMWTIDTRTNTITDKVALYNEPPAVSPDGTRRYVAGYMSVSVVDNETGAVIDTVDLPNCDYCGYGWSAGVQELAVSRDGTRLYARHAYPVDYAPVVSAVTVINTSTFEIVGTAENLVAKDLEVAVDGKVYAIDEDYYYSDVNVYDRDMRYLNTIRLSSHTGSPWSSPTTFAINSDGKHAFAHVYDWDSGGMTVSVIDTDPVSPTYNTETFLTERYSAVSPDGSRFYVPELDGKTITVYETASNAKVGSFTTDNQPNESFRGIAFAPNGTLYIADPGDNTLYAVTLGGTTVL